MDRFERDTVLRFAHMNRQHGNVPYKPNSMEVMSNIIDVVKIKKEPIVIDVQEVNMPMVSIPRQYFHGSAMNFNIGKVNNDLNIGDLYSTHVKLEPKVEGETDSNVELKSKEISHSHGKDMSVGNVNIEQQTKKGDAAPRSSMGMRKKKDIELKGKVEGVNNAAHQKQSAAKARMKQYKCLLCEYVTVWSNNFKTHMRIHTGEKPFSCNICTKRFTQNWTLQNHLRTHNGEMVKFQCMNCTRKFSQEVEKLQHEQKCKRRRYECHLCKTFSAYQKPHLLQHMQTHHTGVKPFQCQLCHKCFTNVYVLRRHQRNVHKQNA